MRLPISAAVAVGLAVILSTAPVSTAFADDKDMIDNNTQRALTWIRASGGDAAEMLDKAAGVLVFPDLVEMGFGVGGEFGEGSLLVEGETVGYYATAGKTFGMGEEADYKAEVIFFMTEEALEEFRRTRSWKVGVHAQVPVMTSNTRDQQRLDSAEPRVGMVFSEDGMVTNLGLDGDRITRIIR